MARDGFKVFDSDMHIMEPPDLWERYIASEFRAQAPRGRTSENVRDLRLKFPTASQAALRTDGVPNKGRNYDKNQTIYRNHSERGWTGEVQLEAMEREGIDLAVLYPTRGLHALSRSDLAPDLAAAVARAYNDWLYDFCAPDRQRLIGVGMISPFDVGDAGAGGD